MHDCGEQTTAPVALRRVDEARARSIVARLPRPGDTWAPGYPTEGDVEAANLLLSQLQRGEEPGAFGIYEIVEEPGGLIVGGIGFHRPPDRCGTVEVGYGLVESARNQGYGTHALRAVIAIARRCGAARVEGRALPDNAASRRVMEKAGMVIIAEEGGYVRYALDLAPARARGRRH